MNKFVVTGFGTISALYAYSLYAKSQNVKVVTTHLSTNETDFKLKLVQVVFRHGARTPIRSPDYLPKIKYEDSLMKHGVHTFVPYETTTLNGKNEDSLKPGDMRQCAADDELRHGELTCQGAEDMYNFGCYLRNHYISHLKYLSPKYDDKVQVRSTGFRRTVESVRCILAGLYPNQETPIPIQIAGIDSEVLFPNFKRCKYLYSLTRWSFIFPDLIDGLKEERLEIQAAFGIPAETEVSIVTLNDCLTAHRYHNVLPAEFDVPKLLEKAKIAAMKIAEYTFSGYHETREAALRLGIGPLLQLFLDNMNSAMTQHSGPKMYLFSAHDTTLLPLLQVLGIEESLLVPFGAHFIFELYEGNGEVGKEGFFVRVLYQHEEKIVCGTDQVMCPLEKFHSELSKYLISEREYNETCEVTNDHLLEKVPKIPPKKEISNQQ